MMDAKSPDARDRLTPVIVEVEQQLEAQRQRDYDERSLERGIVRIMQSSLTMTKGVAALENPDVEEAALVLFRALYERLLDMNQILQSGDPAKSIMKMRASAFIELRAFLEATDPGNDYLELIKEEIEEIRRLDAQAVEEIQEQRKNGRFHWSGKGRLQLESSLPPQVKFYGPLSWIAHGSLGPAFEYTPGIGYETRDVAGLLLLLIWNLGARAAGFPTIPLEEMGYDSVEEE